MGMANPSSGKLLLIGTDEYALVKKIDLWYSDGITFFVSSEEELTKLGGRNE